MSDPSESLLLDLLEWIANRDRSYEDVMDAWRTSCPRFPIWENAKDRGLVMANNIDGRSVVRLSVSGMAFLRASRPAQIL